MQLVTAPALNTAEGWGTTYDELVLQIQQWSEVDSPDFIANIPQFVINAETAIYNQVQVLAERQEFTITPVLQGGIASYPIAKTAISGIGAPPINLAPEKPNPFGFTNIELPPYILALYSVGAVPNDGTIQYLLQKEPEYIREAFPKQNITAFPTHYALVQQSPSSTTIVVGPTSKILYPIVINFLGYPASIVVAGTSWVSQYYPNVLLYGALREAYVYLKGESDLLQMYDAKFKEALADLKMMEEGKMRSDGFRNLQPRVPVQ